MEGDRTVQALWQDYLFLTKEMLKFLVRQEMELFNELMNQRERLQTMIDQVEDCGFKNSSTGRTVLAEVREDNQYIINNLQILLSRSKRYHQVSEAYNGLSTTAVSQMNWKPNRYV